MVTKIKTRIISCGCGWTGHLEQLVDGNYCPECGYYNQLTILEVIDESETRRGAD